MLTAPAARAQEPVPPSENAMVNLIRGLVTKGVFTEAEGQTMIAQAEAEAGRARAANASAASAGPVPATAEKGTSVRYIPQFVRDEIKAEVRSEILTEAQTKGLVAPDAVPAWVRRFELMGDLRVRGQWEFFDKANAIDFVNVGAINAGAPYDPVNNPNLPPIINSLRNRNYMRLRARLGIKAEVDPRLTAHLLLATGENNGPVSTNQTLGGYLARKDLWVDQAYIDYRPVDGAHVFAGRMINPFALTELVWDEDINLDGVAASFGRRIVGGFLGNVAIGAFPLDYVPEDFPAAEFASGKIGGSGNDKWLYAGQIGMGYLADKVSARLMAAYYHYSNVEGGLSPSCFNTAAFCLTDARRPRFLQKGNTLFGIRNLVAADPNNPAAPQYFGVASRFRVLAISGEVGMDVSDGIRATLTGNWSKNLGYNRNQMFARAGGSGALNDLGTIINNNESCSVPLVADRCPAGKTVFNSGNEAWLARATIGRQWLTKRGDWQLSASYRRLAPDSLLDAFTDSDFRLGGTNSKGWTIEGSLGLLNNTFLTLRWLSAEELSGPPFKVDVLQTDINVRF